MEYRYAPYYLEQKTFSPIILIKTYKFVMVLREYAGKQVLTKSLGLSTHWYNTLGGQFGN